MKKEINTSTPENTAVRDRLLSAALQLFSRRGYASTSVREIVESAGVSKPTLYYYFKNKEGIYLALMESSYKIFSERMQLLMGAEGSVRARLETFCLGVFDGFVEYIDVVRFIYAIYFGPPQGAPEFKHDQAYDWILDSIGTLVKEGIDCGEFRSGNPDDLTWATLGCLNTCMEEQLCKVGPRVDRASFVRILKLILDGISTEGTR